VDAFSYLSVLLSIIIGLGMTQVLTACGRLIRHRDRVRAYWLPILWAIVLLVIYVQVWWSMFGLRAETTWTFVGFLIVLAQTAALYLTAALVLPEDVGDAGVDLRAHYDRQRVWFFAVFLATLVISVVKDVILSGRLPHPLNLGFHAGFATVSMIAIATPRRRVQEVIGVACATVIAAYIGLLFATLQ